MKIKKDLTFDQLLGLNECFTKATIASELIYDAVESVEYKPFKFELSEKIVKRFKEISQEITDITLELQKYVGVEE